MDGYLRDVLVLIKLGEIFPFPVLFASAPASDLFLARPRIITIVIPGAELENAIIEIKWWFI